MSNRIKPVSQAALVYGIVLLVFCGYYWARDTFQFSSTGLLILNHAPETLIIAVMLTLRHFRQPWFPFGTYATSMKQYPWLCLALISVAAYFGYLQGSFGPMSVAAFIKLHFTGNFLGSFAEELAFRGGLLTALCATSLGSKSLGKISIGNILQALGFAAIHLFGITRSGTSLQGAITYLVILTTGGLVFGFIYQRTRNLWNCIFLHTLWNLGTG